GFGSFLARVLNLGPADGRILVSIGIGSGIGSIFGAPLGGALLSAEILYRDDIEVEAIVPGIIAAVVGYTVFSAVQGFAPLFGFASGSYQFLHPLALVWFALIGILGGLVGLAYAKVFYATAGAFSGLRIARALKPAIGGVLVGLIALALPGVLGTGYGWIQKSLGHQLLGLPLWVVLALPAAKILTTSLSIGSGGSGGIFGPGMVIGAFTGASVWRLLEPIAPDIPHSPAPFVIVGMMACFGGISRAPLAVMLMTAEMTGSLAVLAPAMVAVGLSTLIVRRADDTIYRSQLANRADSPAHRLQAGMPLLGSIAVTQVMGAPRVIFDARNSAAEAAAKLQRENLPGAPVVDENGVFIGTVSARALQEASPLPDPEVSPEANHGPDVGRLADPTAPTVVPTDRLTTALESLMNAGANWIPVLDEDRRVVGIMSTSGVVRGYRQGLTAGLRQVSQIAPHAVSLDVRVAEGSPAVGRSLRHLGLPPGTIVMTLQRNKDQLLPRGDMEIEVDDTLGVLTREIDLEKVRRTFAAPAGDSSEQS
ncbi:MAG TPA: chloride channel protein, partial [Acidimicrobiales bacterium]|nr:chloride channel protein [Acidimicrobiales bacterium]